MRFSFLFKNQNWAKLSKTEKGKELMRNQHYLQLFFYQYIAISQIILICEFFLATEEKLLRDWNAYKYLSKYQLRGRV